MTLTKVVNGLEVPCSAEEEAAIEAEWQANASAPAPVDPRRAPLAAAGFTEAQIDALLGV